MKKLTVIIALLIISTALMAQSIEITPLFGYTFSGKVDGYYGTFDVKDDISYGGILDVEIDDGSHIELKYQRIDPTVVKEAIVNNRFDIGVEHYQVGFLKEFSDKQVKPFAEVFMGTSRYWQKSQKSNNVWRFSTGFGLGAKIFFTESVGLRLHTNLTMPLEFSGAGLFYGFGSGGSGVSGGVSFHAPIVHWELGGGLILRLPN